MKFSPSGQYLVSGGEDGVVHIWCVTSLDKCSICFTPQDSTSKSKVECDNSYPRKKQLSQPFIFLRNSVFQIEESPLQQFFVHSNDVFDLAWWTKSSWAFLNEPPVIEPASNKYGSQFQKIRG
ncbi:hypothetical protein JHK85_028440 [Glycine max]|nr:hypothetical protein JHK85_028440 [Glycine max]KAG5003794.1 hypothetical protein JHK86_027933 [Glycine max]